MLNFVDDATLSIKPEKDLKPETVYEIKIDFSKFHDAAGNKLILFILFNFQLLRELSLQDFRVKL